MNILKLLKRPREVKTVKPSALKRLEIVLSGSGGQGMILAGSILAEAAAIYDNKEAVMSQSYGPEARGGASRAEVIISSEEIHYPKAIETDVLLTMTEEALNKYGRLLAPHGLLIVDETFIKKTPANIKHIFKAPFSSLALKLLDAPIVANVIALGSLAAITNAVSREALIRAVLARVPKKALVSDRIAVDAGFKLIEDSDFKWEKPF